MKKIIMVAALSLCCCMALTAKVKAAEKVSGNYHYEVLDESKKTATLTRVDNPGTNVVLPSKVDDYKITQIGTLKNNSYDYSSDWSQNAGIFREEQATALTQLVLPQGVEKIGINALKDCEKVASINLPDSLIVIGAEAFRNCKSLTKVTLPKNLKGIGCGAFAECAGIKQVVFKTDEAKVGVSAFSTDNSGKKAENNEGVPTGSHWKKIQMPFHYKGKLMEGAFSGYTGTSFVWRNFTKDNEAFLSGCKTLKKIVFPKKLKKIDIPRNCFRDSWKTLKSFVVPAGVKTVYIGQQYRNLKCITVKGKNTTLEGDYAMDTKHHRMISADVVMCKKDSKAWKAMKKFICPDFSKKVKTFIESDEYYTKKLVHTKKVKCKKL